MKLKKRILIAAILSASISTFAQEKNVTDARMSLENDHDPVAAKGYIEKAILDPSTKNEAKTWFVRASIYLELSKDPKYNMPEAYKEAARSLKEVIKIKPEYESKAVTQNLLVCAYNYFNDGIVAFNDAIKPNSPVDKYDAAIENMTQVLDIHNIENGKRYPASSYRSFDTIAVNAKLVQANSYFFSNRYDNALPLLLELKSNPIASKAVIYQQISEIYSKQNKDSDALAVLQEGRKQFPDDVALRNAELNYYIKSGKEDELVKKLEDAVAKEPADSKNMGELLFALAVGYNNIAFPKDEKAPKPANYMEYATKAEETYKKAIDKDPNNATYNYNLGALYFNEAADVIKQMNDITGTSDADNKKYDALKAKRDELFKQSQPYLEKTYSVLDPKASSLAPEDKQTYHSTVMALKELYAKLGNPTKSNEMKAKLATIH
jgi:hypothetical protein